MSRIDEFSRFKCVLSGIVAPEEDVFNFFLITQGDLVPEPVVKSYLDKLKIGQRRYLYINPHVGLKETYGVPDNRDRFYLHVANVNAHCQESRGERPFNQSGSVGCVPSDYNSGVLPQVGTNRGTELRRKFGSNLYIEPSGNPV